MSAAQDGTLRGRNRTVGDAVAARPNYLESPLPRRLHEDHELRRGHCEAARACAACRSRRTAHDPNRHRLLEHPDVAALVLGAAWLVLWLSSFSGGG